MTETAVKPDTDDELVTWITDELRQAKAHCSEWRKKAEESYDFVASEQWDEEDKSKLQEKGRLPIVFNRIARVVNTVIGLELQNRQEVRYIPRELGDAQVNEVLTSAAKWVRDNCDAEDEESESFQDTLVCGMGWTETRLDYESDPEGKVCIDRVDPLEMLWDKNAKKRNLDDQRWVARVKKIPKTEFNALWPDETPKTPVVDLESEMDQPHDADEAKFYRENQPIKTDDKNVTVIQFQWWERETYHQVLSEQGNIIDFNEAKYKRISKYVTEKGLKHVKRTRKVYKQVFLNGNSILEETPGPCKDSFSFRCITGLRNRNDNTWFGIVELMKDPQRWANKWLSQIMYIISVNAKGGLLAETDAFENVRKAEETWASADSITWMKPGALANGKVKEKGQAQYPEGLDRLLQYALQSINDVPGVNLELMGMADRAQAGYLEAQRKQAGVTILAIFFDSLRRYRKEQGRVLAYFIKEYISDGRLIRVLGDNGQEQYIPLLKDENTYTYDVVVDDAPTSPNMKEKVFAILSELIPQLMSAGIPIPPEILDYTPLPESLVQKWKAMLPDPNQPPPPDPKVIAEQQKMELEKQKAELDAQLQQMKLSTDIETEKQRLELEKQKMAVEAQLEQEKMIIKAQLDQQKLESEMSMKHAQMNAEVSLSRDRAIEDAKIKREQTQIETGEITDMQTKEFTGVLKELLEEIKTSREESKESNTQLIKLVTAERELVRDSQGRAVRSRLVQ